MNQAQADALVAKYKELGRLPGGMMERADTFWDDSKSLRESSPEYFTDDNAPLSN